MVYRYEIGPRTTLVLPKGSKILSARDWKGGMCVWAQLGNVGEETHIITAVPTGCEARGTFVDTVILEDLGLVFHIYSELQSEVL